MWKRPVTRSLTTRSYQSTSRRLQTQQQPVIDIKDATFYHRYPSANDSSNANPALFSGLRFSLPSKSDDPQYWSVVSLSSIARTNFLQVLAGQHHCSPPQARSFPYLSEISQSPQHAIKYVGFDADRGSNVGGTSVRGAYLSARYESRREETDFSVRDYLTGQTELNALQRDVSDVDRRALEEVVDQLNLAKLLHMPVANLSNGQTRRARIAKALMARPELLLLDGPFMGLDPNTLSTMSTVLMKLALKQQPRVIMSLRPEDGVPSWVSHLVIVDEQSRVLSQGAKQDLFTTNIPTAAQSILEMAQRNDNTVSDDRRSRDGFPAQSPALPPGEPLVEMQGVKVTYGDNTVLGNWTHSIDGKEVAGLYWSLHRGQRCGIFGPNGSGKTTMLSLITSDHPQTYSLPIRLFGRSRLPGPGQAGISLFDIQRRMGHSSPEVHAFFPKNLTIRRALESAWADAPLAKPTLDENAKQKVDAFLRWFARDLNPHQHTQSTAVEMLEEAAEAGSARDAIHHLWTGLTIHSDDSDLTWARDLRFRDLPFPHQRLLLFLRALITSPDLIILDEALSGLDAPLRDKALLFLSHGETLTHNASSGKVRASALAKLGLPTVFQGLEERQALLVISHAKEDVPGCVREWICLPEADGEGRAPRTGTLDGPLELDAGRGWTRIWGREPT